MKTSEWFTVVNDDVITHYHISLAPIIPDEHIDIHLAERLGAVSRYVIRRDSDGKYYRRTGTWVESIYEAMTFTHTDAAAKGETAIPIRITLDEPSREVDERGTPVELTKREQERAFWERNFERVVASGSGAERAALEADWATKEWSARWGSGYKAKVGRDAPSVAAYAYVHKAITSGGLPRGVDVWHEGRCLRCNRGLTTPESVARGYGPECADKLGL